MSKYHELVKEYSLEIAVLKALKVGYAEMVDLANAASDADSETLYQEAEIIYQILVEKTVELQAALEAEWHTAPFAKSLQAGVAGFYKAAGLNQSACYNLSQGG